VGPTEDARGELDGDAREGAVGAHEGARGPRRVRGADVEGEERGPVFERGDGRAGVDSGHDPAEAGLDPPGRRVTEPQEGLVEGRGVPQVRPGDVGLPAPPAAAEPLGRGPDRAGRGARRRRERGEAPAAARAEDRPQEGAGAGLQVREDALEAAPGVGQRDGGRRLLARVELAERPPVGAAPLGEDDLGQAARARVEPAPRLLGGEVAAADGQAVGVGAGRDLVRVADDVEGARGRDRRPGPDRGRAVGLGQEADRVDRLVDRVGGRLGEPLDEHGVDAPAGRELELAQGPAGEGRAPRHDEDEQPPVEGVGPEQLVRGELAGLPDAGPVRAAPAAEGDRADEHGQEGDAEPGDLEEGEGRLAGLAEGVAHDDVRGRPDQGQEPAERGREGQRHEEPRRVHVEPGAGRDDGRHEDRHRAGVAHDARQGGREGDDRDEEPALVVPGERDQALGEPAGDARPEQPGPDDEQGRDHDDRRVPERGQGRRRVEDPGQDEAQERQERRRLHGEDVHEEERGRDPEDRERRPHVAHGRPPPSARASPTPRLAASDVAGQGRAGSLTSRPAGSRPGPGARGGRGSRPRR